MRNKLNPKEKRSVITGIKVKPDVEEKLIYLSEADLTQLSTYINNILENHIKIITNIGKVDGDKVIKTYKENKEK